MINETAPQPREIDRMIALREAYYRLQSIPLVALINKAVVLGLGRSLQ